MEQAHLAISMLMDFFATIIFNQYFSDLHHITNVRNIKLDKPDQLSFQLILAQNEKPLGLTIT